MFYGVCFVAIVVTVLITYILIEKLKSKDKRSNMLLGIEFSVVGLALISIGAPNTYDNLFLYVEWFGAILVIMGLVIFQKFYRS